MPWWVVLYFSVFSLFAFSTITGELLKGNVFQAVVEAVPFTSSTAGAVFYWLGDKPSAPAAVVLAMMLALGVPLLVANCVVADRQARAEGEDYTRAAAALTWVGVFALFLPAYGWASMFVARAWQ